MRLAVWRHQHPAAQNRYAIVVFRRSIGSTGVRCLSHWHLSREVDTVRGIQSCVIYSTQPMVSDGQAYMGVTGTYIPLDESNTLL